MSQAIEQNGGVAAAEKPSETKAQRVERLKRELNPWDALEELRRFAREGFDAIPPEWLGVYFKWWGIYTQGDGAGVTGGKGGEGKAVPYLMLRIQVPSGILTSRQLRTIAEVSAKHGRGVADITVRQNFQLHWVTIESLPEVLETLWAAGLDPKGACGDVVRNVTGCPVAGLDPSEIFDASPIARDIAKELSANTEFFNLPRKFKISVSGCNEWCVHPEINDVGLTAVRRTDGGVGFSLRVGGGLSTEPHLAEKLNVFVHPEQAVAVAKAVAELFREVDGLREHRDRARLKYLFLRNGWTAETFLTELERRLGFTLEPAAEEVRPESVYRDHVGIHPQKQAGFSYVGATVLRGRLNADQLFAVADLADRFGSGDIRTTLMQNLLLVNVPNHKTEELAKELEQLGLPVGGSSFARGIVACTGTEFCKLAITETKGFARWLTGELEDRLPGFDQHLKLHVTGCPNSCGQHWIADIGIEGKKIKTEHGLQDAYYFCVGGALGYYQATARPVGYRCLATEVPDAIERLLNQYQQERAGEEKLRGFIARHSNDDLRGFLAGTMVDAAARDLPSGTVPHGVEG